MHVRILLLLLSAVTIASAAPVEYIINFQGSGTLPTGSFQYDAAVPTFSNFIVTWDGNQIDLTSGANAFTSPVCGGVSGAAGAFALLSGSLGSCDTYSWWQETDPLGHTLYFDAADSPSQIYDRFFGSVADVGNPSSFTEYSTFSIQAAVPEPGSLALVGSLLLAGGAILSRRRNSRTRANKSGVVSC